MGQIMKSQGVPLLKWLILWVLLRKSLTRIIRRFSGSDIGAFHRLAKTTDGGYVLAGTTILYSSYPLGSTYVASETFCVCKIDSTGKQQWIKNNYVGNVRVNVIRLFRIVMVVMH
jgi:hypothetical protein